MDGFALRAAELAAGPLRIVGESAAGRGYGAALRAGEAVRIFTGAPVPEGADAILLQEDAVVADGALTAGAPPGPHIRGAGLDFREGAVALSAGVRLGPAELALAAAMNHAAIPVARSPRVAIIASGDELVPPGAEPGPSQIISCNNLAVAATPKTPARSHRPAYSATISRNSNAALARPQARADVCDARRRVGRDTICCVSAGAARQPLTWKIAMRRKSPVRPRSTTPHPQPSSNPVASFSRLVSRAAPAHCAIGGRRDRTGTAIAGADLPEQVGRDYMRARLALDENGCLVATPQPLQDSSLLTELAQSQALLIREPGAPPLTNRDPCRILRLP
jgi:molybdopterin molybdotransferase